MADPWSTLAAWGIAVVVNAGSLEGGRATITVIAPPLTRRIAASEACPLLVMIAGVRFESFHFLAGMICPQRSIPRSDIALGPPPDLIRAHRGYRHHLLEVLAPARGAFGNVGRVEHQMLEL